MITYKYRLYPNKEQQSKLWKHSSILTFVYNYFLNQRIDEYKNNKKSISKYNQQNQLPLLKEQNKDLKEIHSLVLQETVNRLDKTYKSFFKRKFGFPKFKSKRFFYTLIYTQSGFSFDKNKFITKVYGKIPFKQHCNINGNIKIVKISNENNKWFLHITTDYIKPKSDSTKIVGIDLGITNLVTTSDNQTIKNQNHSKYFDKQINKLKSKRDLNYKKRSRHYKFYTKKIQKLYDVKKNKVNDFLHKVSHNLSIEYDTIICENLKTKQMTETSNINGLNRELRNSCLSKFITYLNYKVNNLIKVNPKNTSKMCSNCGNIKDKLPLYKRTYICELCGTTLDRDYNASLNILCLGQTILNNKLVCTV